MSEAVDNTAVAEVLSASGANFHKAQALAIQTFKENLASFGPHLFSTKGKGLSTAYRKAFPEEQQKHNTCTSCRLFFERFGHLVFITPEGKTVPAFWDANAVPEEYRASIKAVEQIVRREGVSGYFWTEHAVWGEETTDGHQAGNPVKWAHYHLPPELSRQVCLPASVDENIGRYRENFTLLENAIKRYPLKAIAAAVLISESCGQIANDHTELLKWFHGVVKAKDELKLSGTLLRNFIWRQVATGMVINPTYPRVGNNVVANMLLEPILKGNSTETAKRLFLKQIDPVNYRRQTAAPTDGNVERARKVFEELGLDEGDLGRRMATIDEVADRFTWSPKPVTPVEEEKKLFGNLSTKQSESKPKIAEHVAPAVTMTWAVFCQKVLPTARTMKARPGISAGNFFCVTAPTKENAGRLFFYDHEDNRNPFCWYTSTELVDMRLYNMVPNKLYDVKGILPIPATWTGGASAEKYAGDIVVLEGLTETSHRRLCLFNELLRHELKEVERVVNAYSDNGALDREVENQAIGLRPAAGAPFFIRVETEFGLADYLIDRVE
jgi:hypothetical protein